MPTPKMGELVQLADDRFVSIQKSAKNRVQFYDKSPQWAKVSFLETRNGINIWKVETLTDSPYIKYRVTVSYKDSSFDFETQAVSEKKAASNAIFQLGKRIGLNVSGTSQLFYCCSVSVVRA